MADYELSLAETAAQHTLHLTKLLNEASAENAELQAKLRWYERREEGALEPLRLSILNDPRCSREQHDAVVILDGWTLDDPFPGDEG